MEIGSERGLLHRVFKGPDGTISECWIDPETHNKGRIKITYPDGIGKEFAYDLETGDSLSVTSRNESGDIVFFEDLAALRDLEKSRERSEEKQSGLPRRLTSLNQIISVEPDRSILEHFAGPDEQSH